MPQEKAVRYIYINNSVYRRKTFILLNKFKKEQEEGVYFFIAFIRTNDANVFLTLNFNNL